MDEALLRTLIPAVIGTLVHRGADVAAAEGAVQDALVDAVRVWPEDPPRNPKGWLVTVAWRTFLDAARADTSRRRREVLVEDEDEDGDEPGRGCGRHAPAVLPVRAFVPDTGLGGRAHAARRRRPDHASDRAGLRRARGHHGPADQPRQADRLGRPVRPPGDVATALRVLHLVLNEGCSGDVDLAVEAIRLTCRLAARTGHEEVAGLLALMLLHRARARPGGSLVPLAEQDRSLWDARPTTESVGVLQTALARGRPGEVQVQAARHADARTAEETDRAQIVGWYDELLRLTGSPVVRLHRAVAIGEAQGPRAGLAALAGSTLPCRAWPPPRRACTSESATS